MLEHGDFWRAIDTLASRYELSVSGLARKAGLDPTTFNKSKRITGSGHRRWPSTESLAKALKAVGATMSDFVGLLEGQSDGTQARRIPVAAQSAAAAKSSFEDAGEPRGNVWHYRSLPAISDPNAYAIVVEGNANHTVLRVGAIVVAAPHAVKAPGDRVVVRTESAELVLAELVAQCTEGIKIKPLGGKDGPRRLFNDQVATVHRIVWAEQ
jgi:phage repressor protein C with HTH and peptisase S24 domain